MTSSPSDKDSYNKLFGASQDEQRKSYNTPAPLREARQKPRPLSNSPKDSEEPSLPDSFFENAPKPQAPTTVSRRDREAAVTNEEKDLYRDIFGTEADIESIDPDGREMIPNWQTETPQRKKGENQLLQGEAQADLILSQTDLPKMQQSKASATSSVATDWRHNKRTNPWLLIKIIPVWIRFIVILIFSTITGKYLYDARFNVVDFDGNDLVLPLSDYLYVKMTMPAYQRQLQKVHRNDRPLVITEGRMRLLYEEGIRYINATKRFPSTVAELREAGFEVSTISTDGWRNELLFEFNGDDLRVRSAGEDGVPKNGDDYTLSPDGFISAAAKANSTAQNNYFEQP